MPVFRKGYARANECDNLAAIGCGPFGYVGLGSLPQEPDMSGLYTEAFLPKNR